MRNARWRWALVAVLFLPGLARAFLPAQGMPAPTPLPQLRGGEDAGPPGEGERRPLLVRKVDKVAVRPTPMPEDRPLASRGELLVLPPDPAGSAPRGESIELTKPASLRIFLFATPQNHRAPPV